jgi:hypothetical protein
VVGGTRLWAFAKCVGGGRATPEEAGLLAPAATAAEPALAAAFGRAPGDCASLTFDNSVFFDRDLSYVDFAAEALVWPNAAPSANISFTMSFSCACGFAGTNNKPCWTRLAGAPEEVAPAFLFLASAAARFVTGTTLCVDGGYTAGRDHGVTKRMGL